MKYIMFPSETPPRKYPDVADFQSRMQLRPLVFDTDAQQLIAVAELLEETNFGNPAVLREEVFRLYHHNRYYKR